MNYESLSNKKFAFSIMNALITNNALTERDINILTNEEECKRLFECTKFPILAEVARYGSLNTSDYCDDSGRNRYYKDKIIIGEKAFIITNHWYGPGKSVKDNRTPFFQWASKKLKL